MEEVVAANKTVAEQVANVYGSDPPDPRTPTGLIRLRSLMEEGGVYGTPRLDNEAEERTVSAGDREIRIRVLRAEKIDAVYLNIHGGAWMMGSCSWNDQGNLRLAQACRMAVVSVGYRLAPEWRYPAAHDDCEAVALWLVTNAKKEFGSGKLLIGGQSAGAHLVVATLLRLRDRHDAVRAFLGATLDCGKYDLTDTPSAAKATVSNVDGLERLYFEDRSFAQLREPDISPLYGDLAGLPPALFTVGTADPLLDDSLFLAARWAIAGNRAELAVYPEGPHGVPMSPTQMGRRATRRIETFLEDIISRDIT